MLSDFFKLLRMLGVNHYMTNVSNRARRTDGQLPHHLIREAVDSGAASVEDGSHPGQDYRDSQHISSG
jgi:hypothetical protein